MGRPNFGGSTEGEAGVYHKTKVLKINIITEMKNCRVGNKAEEISFKKYKMKWTEWKHNKITRSSPE